MGGGSVVSPGKVLESERLLILRDFTGALEAAMRHIEGEGMARFVTRERALAVAVQALQELGRGEEAFELVLSKMTGSGSSSVAQQYAQLAELDLGLLKLLFRLRMHLDGTPEHAQSILAPYIARLCKRRDDSYQRWKDTGVEDDVDLEAVELFVLDCVLVLEGAEIAARTLESFDKQLPEDAVSSIRREIFRCELEQSSTPPPSDTHQPSDPPSTTLKLPAFTATTWHDQDASGAGAGPDGNEYSWAQQQDDKSLVASLIPTAISHPATPTASHHKAAHALPSTNTSGVSSCDDTPLHFRSSLRQYLLQLWRGAVRRYKLFLAKQRPEFLAALMSFGIPLLIFWAARSRIVLRSLRVWLSMLQVGGVGGGAGMRVWGPVCAALAFLISFIAML